jgi:hypothetical protein
MLVLVVVDMEHSFREDKTVQHVANGDNDTTFVNRKSAYETDKAQSF